MFRKKPIRIITFFVISGFLFSCNNFEKQKTSIDFSDTVSTELQNDTTRISPVYIAIASMTSPRETFNYYHNLIDFISEKIDRPIYFKQKKTYKEVNDLLENGEVDFAFICSGAYVEEMKKGKIKLLVAPKINNQTYYQAYIITGINSGLNSFMELEASSFAYTDPLSNTGYLYPRKLLQNLNATEEEFFSKTIYTYGHDISIQMVNRGIIDAASVHGLIFDYISTIYPERVENVKVIDKSELFGMPPVVTRSGLENKYFNKYQEVFLNIHNDSIGAAILSNLKIEKFVIVHDSIYDNIRQL